MRGLPPRLTTGIDLSAEARDTAICRIDWQPGRGVVQPPDEGAHDPDVLAALHEAHAESIGVDCPFGWPDRFVEAVAAHTSHRPWPDRGFLGPDSREALRLRATDRYVRPFCPRPPLSVSSDRIGVVAMRWAGLLDEFERETRKQVDRAGSGRLCEVYPAAALHQWGLHRPGYKDRNDLPRARYAREEMVADMRAALPDLEISDEVEARCLESHDVLDALIAALVARAKTVGAVLPLPDDEADREAAIREGWIAVPTTDALTRLCPAG